MREAWLTYADHMWPDGNREARLRALWRGTPEDTLDETDRRLTEAERFERGLKSELLGGIQDGEFTAYGRDISKTLDSAIIPLPSGLFDPAVAGFEVDWGTSSVLAHGRKVIEVRVLPADQIDVTTTTDVENSANAPREEAAKTAGVVGRPNTERDFKAAVLAAIEKNPDFLIEGDRTSQAREIRARLFGSVAGRNDNMGGCTTEIAKRWIGEVATARRRSSD